MFENAKYIVVGDASMNEKMIVFPPSLKHETVFNVMKRARFETLVSAGFIDEFCQCYGESVSTYTKSRKEIDTLILKQMLRIDDKKLMFI